ncbi:SurA N-terminal domain-containing protein [Bacillus pinisoli]|uniref:SurA N-terminal domain-containing protein n=1 Tax=Bacillus pinisoli TaxID=2901866 RepID=UPI001FF4CD6D|nr:SurA N-terminal domain-containing protein [Bacillus pinisoli]
MKQRILIMLLAIVSLFILGACNNNEDAAKDNEGTEAEANEENRVLATVNGKEILKSDYDLILEDTIATYAEQGVDVNTLDDETKKKLRNQLLDQLINTELLLQQAEKEGIQTEDESVNERLDEMKAQFEDEEKFNEALEENNITEVALKERIKNEMQISTYLENSIGEVTVSEEEITKVYDQYKQAMESQEQEVQELDAIKDQLEQQAVIQKRQEKISELIEQLRADNEIKIL